ncbi:hypothetical protein PPL_06744 [Heterostelium album PN500]|uniref:Uncharacterized protein n=1 Tax=Heterostelium pallidum (strain ATCC 26659 / Pp 5 / PN500) TaxID=670386 RepID=D3BFL0_HETP5|nr:hypothetical protein PPL_06744 [Heterostelium album PN500]EFA79924.1 hypothetical protein PPL_06744 [Heterostelium album PN500]|eukprot:XP_020432044.1 hypothetical protein PPL_06744 [Heterostelium album PN500]
MDNNSGSSNTNIQKGKPIPTISQTPTTSSSSIATTIATEEQQQQQQQQQQQFDSNNDFKSIVSLIFSGKIPLTLAVQWLSSTKSTKYSISNDYTSIRELNQRSPLQFSHYLVDELRNAYNHLFTSNNTILSNSITGSGVSVSGGRSNLQQQQQQQIPKIVNDFPPLPSKPTNKDKDKEKDKENSNQHQQQQQQQSGLKLNNLPIITKIESDQIDSIVELYSNILFNRLYRSSLMSELNFLIKILSSLQKLLHLLSQWHQLSATPEQQQQQQPYQLFTNLSWTLHFVLRTLFAIRPLLNTLNPRLLLQLSDNQIYLLLITFNFRNSIEKVLTSSIRCYRVV